MANDEYASATAHYASPLRTDPVKEEWERPFLCGLLARTLGHVTSDRRGTSSPVRFVDLGAGAGEGLELLERVTEGRPAPPLAYLGIDRSAAMLRLAAQKVAASSVRAEFTHADMTRYDYAAVDGTVFVSLGASFSEQSPEELAAMMTLIFDALSQSDLPSAILFDVYGRYCPAWLPVAAARRDYSMSFFQDTARPPAKSMHFYTPHTLSAVLDTALSATRLSSRALEIRYVDRSIFTSRHTTTKLYNPQIPNIRAAVNKLLRGDVASAPSSDLELDLATGEVPDHTAANAIRRSCTAWNRVVHDRDAYSPAECVAALRELNNAAGVDAAGIGHYLTVLVLIQSG